MAKIGKQVNQISSEKTARGEQGGLFRSHIKSFWDAAVTAQVSAQELE